MGVAVIKNGYRISTDILDENGSLRNTKEISRSETHDL